MKTVLKPNFQAFTLPEVFHINPIDAAVELANANAIIVDVREHDEQAVVGFDTEMLECMPFSGIAETFANLAKDKNLIIACSNGIRSVKVVNLLKHQGFTSVVNLDGGINQWYSDGLPLLISHEILDSSNHCNSSSSGCGCCGGH